jgi:hypothetical protein
MAAERPDGGTGRLYASAAVATRAAIGAGPALDAVRRLTRRDAAVGAGAAFGARAALGGLAADEAPPEIAKPAHADRILSDRSEPF